MRLLLITFTMLLALAVPSAQGRGCTEAHHCSKVLIATPRLAHWRSPQMIPANADLQVGITSRGRDLRYVEVDALTGIFLGRSSSIAKVTAARRRAPLRVTYGAARRVRLRVVYWFLPS